MKDPLTVTQKRVFFATFEAQWRKKYKAALDSGAIDILDAGDHALAKICLTFAAEDFRPISKEGKAQLANLRHFV